MNRAFIPVSVAWLLVTLLTWLAPSGCVAADASLRDGAVRRVTGETLTGGVGVVTNGVSVVPSTGAPTLVPWAEVMEVSFDATKGVATRTGDLVAGSSAPTTSTNNVTPMDPTVLAWRASQVGTSPPGRIEEAPESLTVTAAGRGLAGNADACFLAERRLDSSGQISASLEAFDGGAAEGAAGIMLRDNLGESAAYAFLGQRIGSGICFQYRQIASGMTMRVTNIAMTLPAWLRLSRVGGAVLAEVSGDGLQWSQVGRVNVNLGQNVRAGLAVASGSDEAMVSARFRKPAVGARGLGYVATSGYPRLRMRGGSTLVGPVESADDSVIRLGGPWKGTLVSTLNVARMEFAPLSPDHEARLEEDRSGVMLADGDFLDGRLRAVVTNTATISSLLFGYRRFAIGSEAAVVVIGAPEDEETPFYVDLANGSQLRARELVGTAGQLRAESPLLGDLRIPWEDVRRIRRTAGRP